MALATKKRIIWSISISVGAFLFLVFAGPFIEYKEVSNWACPVSGSTRREIKWLGCFSHEERTTSALEKWLAQKEPGFQPKWEHLSTQNYFVVGWSCATSGTPEIYHLLPLLDSVVEKLGDERIGELVAVLRRGSRDEQRLAIAKIADEVIEKTAPAERMP